MKQKKICPKGSSCCCNGNCADEALKIQQRILEREVDEDLRREQLARWWKKYRFFVFGFVACVILGTAAHEWYAAWRTKVQTAESDRFEAALVLAAQDKTDEALTALRDLSRSGRTGYRFLAELQYAAILMARNDPDGLTALRAAAENPDMPEPLRDAALISYVGHLLNTGNTVELQQMIAPLTGRPNGAFYGQAMVLKALLENLSGDGALALQTVERALTSTRLSPTGREQLLTLKDELTQ